MYKQLHDLQENVFSETPLHAACTSGRNMELVAYLLRQPGVDPNFQGQDGHTGLLLSNSLFFFFYSYRVSALHIAFASCSMSAQNLFQVFKRSEILIKCEHIEPGLNNFSSA